MELSGVAWRRRFSSLSVAMGQGKPDDSSAKSATPVPPPTAMKFPKILSEKMLNAEQRKRLEAERQKRQEDAAKYTEKQKEEISRVSSRLYSPRNPLESSDTSRLIRQRLASIERRLDVQRKLEEARLAQLEKKQAELSRPRVADFKRPLAACFLLALSVYMGLQYLWYALEGQEKVLADEQKTRQYERQVQALLDEQTELVRQHYDEKPRSGVMGWFVHSHS